MDPATETPDIPEFLERFRQSLQSQNLGAEGDLPALLGDYGRLCEKANQRLRECSALIKRGQYSNAIALAEREPNLLDFCALLEIQERDLLASVAQFCGTKAPTLVNRDLVGGLQEAYQKDETATDDLKMLHRLTLARAPLPTRLAIMRRLLVQNPNHPFMGSDIRAFEKAWFKQALQFVQPFVKQNRREVIQEVIQDLRDGGYVERPPSTLISHLQAQVAKAQAAYLALLAAEIRLAFSERSIETLTQLAERWRSLSADAGSLDANLRFGVTEALDWLGKRSNEEREKLQKVETESLFSGPTASQQTSRLDSEATDRTTKTTGVDGALEPEFPSHSEKMGCLRSALPAGSALAALLLIGVAVLAFVWATRSPSHPPGAEEIARKAAFARALKDIENAPPDGDVKPLLEAARKYAISDLETEEIGRMEQLWKSLHEAPKRNQKLEFDKRIALLEETSRKLRADVRRGRDVGGLREKIEDLRNRFSELRQQAGQLGFGDSELRAAEKSIGEIESWGMFAVNLTAFREKMKTQKGTRESLELLADFLDKTIASNSPDPDMAQHAKLARISLPTWAKMLDLQGMLQTEDFLTHAIDDDLWKGQPPAGPLAAAGEYSEMLRNRDPAIQGSKSAKLKERLGRKDISNLWVIRQFRGDLARSYTNEQPAPGQAVANVDVLRNSDGEKARVPFGGERQVDRAPQSIFAERAARLWESPERGKWDESMAEVYDELLESKKMDELLKLDLARRLLDLAVSTSVGYRELLQGQQSFKSVTGISALIEGNWLDPGNDQELKGRRGQAEELIANAPRLRPLAAAAATRDEQRLIALKQGLILAGWICWDDEAHAVIAPFDEAKPAPKSRLYTVASGKWVNLGSVSEDGVEIRLTDTAGQYVGWPVFALLFVH